MAAGGAETAIQFGISLVPATERLDRLRELVRAADEAALDLIGIQDHPYQRRFLDTWSLIPALLTETKRISLLHRRGEPAAAAARRDGEGRRVARRAERRPLRARPGRRRLPRRDRGLWRPAANAGRIRGGARRGDRRDQAVVVRGTLGFIRGEALPPRWRASRPPTRAPNRDLGGSVQAAHAPPRGSEGRRLAAVARGAEPRRAARRQRADRRGGRKGGP